MKEVDKNTRVYYSHSMSIYNTERERRELEFLRSLSDRVICPNNGIGKSQVGERTYLKIVEWADLVVVSVVDGKITSGVRAEMREAFTLNIPVKLIENNRLIDVTDFEAPYFKKNQDNHGQDI